MVHFLSATVVCFAAALDSLLVSWGGFGRPAEQEARAMHFNIRLWSSDQLLEAVFDNYEQLPAGIRAELPLKRLWALVQEEGG